MSMAHKSRPTSMATAKVAKNVALTTKRLFLQLAAMRPLLMLVFLAAFVLLPQIACLFISRMPAPFNDKHLPGYSQRQDADSEFFENLGQVIKLDSTLLSVMRRTGSAKFSVYNRRKSTDDLEFEPHRVCFSEDCSELYQFNLDQVAASGFNASLRTIIMISGFLTKDRVGWMERSKELWLQIEDVNVILVTWKDLNRYYYGNAVANTPIVSRQTTILLYYLAAFNGLKLDNVDFVKRIHFIGHSLGAHIAGFVGKDLGGKVGRITGLDPAGPYFDTVGLEKRLDRSDALLVDILHTNSGRFRYRGFIASATARATSKLFENILGFGRAAEAVSVGDISVQQQHQAEEDSVWYGLEKQIGHIDYFANGGRLQPGCLDALHMCDHKRSHDIYEAILSYEIQLRNFALSSQQRLGQDRLMAFSSPDYESFLAGDSFASQCPSLLSTADAAGGATPTSSADFTKCTLPIDLLTPVDDLRHELTTKYGFNFAHNNYSNNNEQQASAMPSTNQRRFYFKTYSDSPLVGDHSLLKIGLYSDDLLDDEYWQSSCTLRAELKFGYGISTTVEVNRGVGSRSTDNREFKSLLATPFVSPLGTQARDGLNRILMTSMLKSGPELSTAVWDPLINVLPVEIILSVIDESKSAGAFQIVKHKIHDLLSSIKDNSNQSPIDLAQRCRLQVRTVEVQPLVAYGRIVVGLYRMASTNYNGGSSSMDGVPVPTGHAIGLMQPEALEMSGLSSTTFSYERSIKILKPGEQVALWRNLYQTGQLSVDGPNLIGKIDALAIE